MESNFTFDLSCLDFLSHLCDVEYGLTAVDVFSHFLSHLCDVEFENGKAVRDEFFLSHLCDVE